MRPIFRLFVLALFASAFSLAAADAPNALTAAEKAAGWQLLFDGQSTALWRSHKGEDFPASGWEVKDGMLSVTTGNGSESARDGDIITRRRYINFELVVDFRITTGANSGVKYFVQPSLGSMKGGPKATVGSAIGYEYQILDDEHHPDAKLGRNGNRTAGSLYDLLPADPAKKPVVIGEWNTARIVVRGPKVEHWLNGKLALAYDRTTAPYKEALALSKFKAIEGFGTWTDGHILLQEHGNRVDFRNIKIRELGVN